MGQWTRILASFSTGQRVALLAAAVAVVAGLAAFTRWRHEKDFRPLYTALDPEDAAAVVARLKESGVEYRISEDGRAVLAPAASVAELRLSMATAGLPRNGRIGFELFDKTSFGATEFTEQVNYGRAIEGELERSINSMSEVERARVHVTFPKDSVFVESRRLAKGSVLVKLRPGARLTPQNVLAICHLVASAVDGLTPEAVTVVDMDGNLLSRPRKAAHSGGGEPPEAVLEYRQSLEKDLLAKIHTTLEPLLGAERFRASVSADCDFTSGEQSEETFDPSRSVMTASQRTEDLSGTAAASGVPGTASNLPRPAARPASAQGGVARRTENVTYQSSRVVRRLRLPVGSVKRLSVSILVDYNARWEGTGAAARRVVEPPAPEKLKSIQQVVAAAIGFQPERGDQLVVESLPFDATLNFERPPEIPPAPAGQPQDSDWLNKLLKTRGIKFVVVAGAGLLFLVIALAALFLRKRSRGAGDVSSPRELPPGETGAASGQTVAAPSGDTKEQAQRAEGNTLELPPPQTKRAHVVTAKIQEMVRQDAQASAQVLRTWLTEEEG